MQQPSPILSHYHRLTPFHMTGPFAWLESFCTPNPSEAYWITPLKIDVFSQQKIAG